MRVGIVVRRLSPRGGLEGNVLGLARHLVASGHSVEIYCQRHDAAAAIDAEVIRVGAPSVLGESVKLAAFAQRAAELIQQRRPEVSFTSGHAFGVDLVRLEGGLVEEYARARTLGRGYLARARLALDFPERVAASIERKKLEGAKLILALSERDREAALRHANIPAERVRVVRNGIALSRFQLSNRQSEARARLGVEGAVIAFVGSGFERKGLDLLLAALASPEAPRATLLVAGEDSRSAAYARRAAALGIEARFLGRLDDVREVLAAADILALPARYEPFGLVVLEALACGRPAVLSAAVGAAEVSPHPELVVQNPFDAVALARALAAGLRRSNAPDAAAVCRAAAERHPLEASYAAIEALLGEGRAR